MNDEGKNPYILNELSSAMRCAVFTNPHGGILIVHDRAIKGDIDYIEYDPEQKTFSLIFADGKMQPLGIEFNSTIKNNLLNGQQVVLSFLDNGEIQSSQTVAFLIRDI